MASRFALASPRSSTVRFFHENGSWERNVQNFPPNTGKLVDSGGELLFFVGIMNGPSLEPSPAPKKLPPLLDSPFSQHSPSSYPHTVDWAQVTTWNPFTGEIVTLPRPPSVTSFPFLVRVQQFHRHYSFTDVPIPLPSCKRTIRFLDLEGSPYFAHGDVPPLGGYIFTMVGDSETGTTVMDCYYRYPEKEFWRSTPCTDEYELHDVRAAGLYPPRVVFRDPITGGMAKFAAEDTLFRTFPDPHVRVPCAKLDDLHAYMFLLPVPGSSPRHLTHFQVELHKRQDQAPEIVKPSPTFELMDGLVQILTFGAKNAALVVQYDLRPGSQDFDPKVNLYCFKSNSWIEVQGSLSVEFQYGDFEMALLCETTTSALASTDEVTEIVEGASSSRSNNQGSKEGDENV